MNSSAITSDIRYLLHELDGSNFDLFKRELYEYVGYGKDGSILLLLTCLNQMNLRSGDHKMSQKPGILAAIFRHLLVQKNFSTVLSETLKILEVNERFLSEFSDTLQLMVPEKITFGLALMDSENLDIQASGQKFCMHEIEEVTMKLSDIDSAEEIHKIILFFYRSESLLNKVDSFIQMLSSVELKADNTFILLPFISKNMRDVKFSRNMDLFYVSGENEYDSILSEMETEASMGDIMRELGYGCSFDISHCKEVLSLFLPLTEVTVSRILGTLVRTYTGLEDSQSLYSTFLSALGSTATADFSCLSSWNVDVIVNCIKEIAPRINWVHVMENLDHEGFFIPDADSFAFFMSFYSRACQDPFPLHSICGYVWKNIDGQLSFLQYAVLSPPEIFTFAHSSRQLGHSERLGMEEDSHRHSNSAWSSLDLLEVLCRVAEQGHTAAVRAMLVLPLKHCPEIVLLGLARINTPYNLLQYEVFSTILPMIIDKSSAGVGIIQHLWHCNPQLVLRGFVDINLADRGSMVRILDICEELKILTTVLEMVPFGFGIHLAVLAYQRECINLEKWLGDNLCNYGDVLFQECFKFLRGLSPDASGDLSGNPRAYSDICSIFLKVLHANGEHLSSSSRYEELRRLHLQLASVPGSSCQQDNMVSDSQNSDGFGRDIENEANSYFQQVFSGSVTMDAMIQMLGRFKESSEEREQSVFNCMVHNLFAEYGFFPKYPDMQLTIAATLFGSLIKHKLVTHLTLGVALRYVLDALRKPADSKLFIFGSTALKQFLDRLVEWPQYCNHILQISHLRSAHPEFPAFIERVLARISGPSDFSGSCADQHSISGSAALENLQVSDSSLQILGSKAPHSEPISSQLLSQQKSQSVLSDKGKLMTTSTLHSKPPMHSSGDSAGNLKTSSTHGVLPGMSSGILQSSRGGSSTRFGSALNIETLVAAAERRETQIEIPASEVEDKIYFMINNISLSNVDAKAKEFSEILSEQYYPWFSQYMVMKRASIEPNFHDLYLKFLEKINSKLLNKEIVKAAYENCKVLLRSDLIKSSSEERSLLKNLGSWLGKFTIGRNQVLRAREIDPKSLIVEAYEKGLMIALIPFTSKILEPCKNSLAYCPPNPWTMGILSLLVEISALPNLKMNLKFDIQVLFKTLGLDMEEVTPTSLLQDRDREVEGNPDFSNKDAGGPQPQIASEISTGIISTLNQIELQSDIVSPSRPSMHLNVVPQYAAAIHLSSSRLTEEKFAALNLSDRMPPGQGVSQVAPSQQAYSAGQLSSAIPNIGNHVVVNQKLNALGLNYFQSVVPMAIERALKEVTAPVVQRSVTIATHTTKELVMKDYAMETDETRIMHAANLMAASLAGSLAHVTCKEPLRSSMSSQLRNFFQSLNMANDILEVAVPLVMNDNLDLGCAAVEQSAMEQAIRTVDLEIGKLLVLRRNHREGVGPSYFEASIYTQGPMGMIPEALRPRPGHLSHSQQRVYEDFVCFPWKNQPGQSSSGMQSGATATSVGSATAGVTCGYTPPSGQLNSTSFSVGIGGGSDLNTVTTTLDASSETDSSAAHILSSSRTGFGVGTNPGKLNTSTSFAPHVLPDSVETTMGIKELAGNAIMTTNSVTEQLTATTEPMLNTGDVLEEYHNVEHKLESMIGWDVGEAEIQGVISQIPEIILKCVSRDEAALAVGQKVFKCLYDNPSDKDHVGAHLMLLAAIRDVCKLVVKEVTSWVMYSDEDRKFNINIIAGLIRKDLLNLAEYNVHMSKLLDGGRNKPATNFAISLLEFLLLQDSRVSVREFPNLLDALSKIAAKPGSPESLQHLIEVAKNPNAAIHFSHAPGNEDKARRPIKNKPSDKSFTDSEDICSESVGLDLSGLREQVSVLFTEWYQIYDLHNANDVACTRFISQLQKGGFLNGDEISDLFFYFLTELSAAHCVSSDGVGPASLSVQSVHTSQITFAPIDVYAKLVCLILKYCIMEMGPGKLSLFPKILSATIRVIEKEAEEKKAFFNPRPYFRLFVNWLFDLVSSDSVIDGSSFQVLIIFANAFHALQPLKVPAFSFAWLELISHRTFMPKLLMINPPKGWVYVQRLLVDLFKFMEPYLRNAELGKPIEFLYKGTLRVLLVLLHDFPEFLCDYHFSLCDVIPSSCIQMRNVILSAFPRNMRLPDPSTPNLKIDLLVEIVQSPRIFSDVDAALKAKQIKSDVDEYLKTRLQPSSFLSELKSKLFLQQSEAAQSGTRYNVPLINSLVLYVGMQTIPQLQAKTPPLGQPMAHNGPMELYSMGAALDIFQTLIAELDTEGRYLFLNAIANQLRYPNNHTHFFSFALLYLFVEANQEIIQEQITRVLLERLIVNRPHPWGLLITFIELIKNSRYNFWSRSFTRCAPEIEKLFDSVSRSCGGPKPDDSMSPGGIPDMH